MSINIIYFTISKNFAVDRYVFRFSYLYLILSGFSIGYIYRSGIIRLKCVKFYMINDVNNKIILKTLYIIHQQSTEIPISQQFHMY